MHTQTVLHSIRSSGLARRWTRSLVNSSHFLSAEVFLSRTPPPPSQMLRSWPAPPELLTLIYSITLFHIHMCTIHNTWAWFLPRGRTVALRISILFVSCFIQWVWLTITADLLIFTLLFDSWCTSCESVPGHTIFSWVMRVFSGY